MMFCDGFPVLFSTVSDCLTLPTGARMVIFTRDICVSLLTMMSRSTRTRKNGFDQKCFFLCEEL